MPFYSQLSLTRVEGGYTGCGRMGGGGFGSGGDCRLCPAFAAGRYEHPAVRGCGEGGRVGVWLGRVRYTESQFEEGHFPPDAGRGALYCELSRADAPAPTLVPLTEGEGGIFSSTCAPPPCASVSALIRVS